MEFLRDFDRYDSFLTQRDESDEAKVWDIFEKAAFAVKNMGQEKLFLPDGFVRDLTLYADENPHITLYFEDVEKRYLLLSDLHGFLKLKSRFKNV